MAPRWTPETGWYDDGGPNPKATWGVLARTVHWWRIRRRARRYARLREVYDIDRWLAQMRE